MSAARGPVLAPLFAVTFNLFARSFRFEIESFCGAFGAKTGLTVAKSTWPQTQPRFRLGSTLDSRWFYLPRWPTNFQAPPVKAQSGTDSECQRERERESDTGSCKSRPLIATVATERGGVAGFASLPLPRNISNNNSSSKKSKQAKQ